MVCKKCGNELRENEKFCRECGYYNDTDDEEDRKQQILEGEMDSSEEKKDFFTKKEIEEEIEKPKKQKKEKKKKPKTEKIIEEYSTDDNPNVVAYIGEDYKWIAERPFNIYALLMSWIYFLYRKLYLIGTLGLVLTGFVIRLFPKITPLYIVVVMMACGIFFNKIYLDIAERKVAKIEKNANNLDNVEEICRKKGGVNVWIPLVIFFLFLVGLILSYYTFSTTKPSKYWNENSMNQANCKSIGRRLYESIGDDIKVGELKEIACEIKGSTDKTYNYYFVIEDNIKTRYLYYENDEYGNYYLKGDTNAIAQLEATQKQFGLTVSDEVYLKTSKDLSNRYKSVKADSDHEDELIKTNKDFKEKTHYIFTKDDIYH